MRRKLLSLTIATAAAAMAAAPAYADAIVNGGFDDGMNGLEGWTTNAGMVQTPATFNHRLWPDPNNPNFSIADFNYGPVDGWRFAAITADQAETPVMLSQTFSATGGVTVRGSAAFLAEDAMDAGQFNDYGFVRITRGSWSQTLFSASVSSVGDFGYTPWTGFSIFLADPGEYTIEAGVANATDEYNPSFLLVDAFSVTPEPGTWAMMIGGFFGAGLMLRRRAARA